MAASIKTPGYRRQRRDGKPDLAFVEFSGRRVYLGEYDTPESHRRYASTIAEWQAAGRLPPAEADGLTVLELVDRYWTVAKSHYRKPDGTPTTELDLVRRAMNELVRLYADLPAQDFSPLKLKAVREKMIDNGWCRKVVNGMTHRVKRVFRWAVENELAPATVDHALRAVAGLKKGRSEARESDPVLPVPDAWIEQTLPHLSPQVAAIVRLQLLTGARPGEICAMRACDIERVGDVWTYSPATHKTQHHGHGRVVYLGPLAQQIVRSFLKPEMQAYIFSPAEAEAWHRERRSKARKTPLSCGNRPGTNRKRHPDRRPGDYYTVTAYRRAIARACDLAFSPPEHLARLAKESRRAWLARLTAEERAELRRWVKAHRWNPHRLRHNAATRVRAEHGIDVAQTILGHRLGSGITEIYAEANVKKARDVILAIG